MFPGSTSTPGTLAPSRSFMLVMGRVCTRLSARTVEVALGVSLRDWSPDTVDTTASSVKGVSLSARSTVAVSPAATRAKRLAAA